MKTGKLTPQELSEIVFSNLPPLTDQIACGPGNGLDCAAIRHPGGFVVMSSDPITGASKDIGSLAVHVSCNDLAAFGVRPAALMLVLIAPVDAEKEDINRIMKQVGETAALLETVIAGGHTEISDAVNRFVLTTTAIGFETAGLIKSGGAKPDDYLIMTKKAALEGTAIIAADMPEKLADILTPEQIKNASDMIKQISVVPEGICGGELRVHAMHDATEGGILGAAWEMAEAAGIGIEIELEKIPVDPLTISICNKLGLNPYRLISSGSMLMATDEPDKLLAGLQDKKIEATIIGRFVHGKKRIFRENGKNIILDEPDRDELYRCFE